MLVLTRRPGESFYIGDNVKITVHSIRGDGVRVSIDAPREVSILRAELKEAGDVNKESSAAGLSAVEALRKDFRRTESS